MIGRAPQISDGRTPSGMSWPATAFLSSINHLWPVALQARDQVSRGGADRLA
jgi:hypothetical protein